MKKIIIFTLLFWVVLLAGCIKEGADLPRENEKTNEKIWVEIDPIQCLGNPWERDWTRSHVGNESRYPREQGGQGEIQIIKDYYQKKGITIFDIKPGFNSRDIVCAACDCPRGDTLRFLVSNSDVDKMLKLSYKVSSNQ